MIGADFESAWAVSGNAPLTLPTLYGPLPKSTLRVNLSSAERAERPVRVGDERRERVALLSDRCHELCAVDEEARERRGVAVELAEQAARCRERWVQVVEGKALLLGLARVLRGGVPEEGLDRGPRRRVERVEEL